MDVENSSDPPSAETQPDCQPHVITTTPCKRLPIEPGIILLFLAYYAFIPLTDQYLYSRFAKEANFSLPQNASECFINKSDPEFVLQAEIQSRASHFVMFLYVAYILPSIIVSTMLGAYSDKVGRKVALILPLIGIVLRSVLYVLVVRFTWPIWVLIISALIDGLLGGVPCFIVASFSYVADVSDHSNRLFRIVLVEVSIGFGSAVSNIALGFLLKSLGFLWPCVIMTSILGLALLYTSLIPETKSRDPEATFFTFDHYRRMFSVYMKKDPQSHRRFILLFSLGILFLVCSVDLGCKDVFNLFMLAAPICFSPVLIGLYAGVTEIVRQGGCAITVKLLQRRLKDQGLLILGACGGILYTAYFGLCFKRIMVFFAPLCSLFSFLPTPIMRGIMSKQVDGSEQGAMFSGITVVQLLAALTGSQVANGLYSSTQDTYAGAAFMVMAGMYLIALFLTIVLWIRMSQVNPTRETLVEAESEEHLLEASDEQDA